MDNLSLFTYTKGQGELAKSMAIREKAQREPLAVGGALRLRLEANKIKTQSKPIDIIRFKQLNEDNGHTYLILFNQPTNCLKPQISKLKRLQALPPTANLTR